MTDFFTELDRSTATLIENVGGDDGRETWIALIDVLAWMNRTEKLLEKRLKNHSSDYFQRRTEHPYGDLLAAVIYFRGEVEHAGQRDPFSTAVTKGTTWSRVGDGIWRESAASYRIDGGDWVSADAPMQGVAFPELHDNTMPDRKYKRDVLYRQHVQGRPVTAIVSLATECLRSIAASE